MKNYQERNHKNVHNIDCCDQKSRAAYAQSFALWQLATIEFTCHDHSSHTLLLRSIIDIVRSQRLHATITLLLLVHATYMYGVVLHAHPIRGESHIQRNTTGEVATTSPPFYNEPHRSHVLCVKAEFSTTFTSWSQQHFVVIGNPKRHMHKASHCGSWQQ